jgi:hypothetical protein
VAVGVSSSLIVSIVGVERPQYELHVIRYYFVWWKIVEAKSDCEMRMR